MPEPAYYPANMIPPRRRSGVLAWVLGLGILFWVGGFGAYFFWPKTVVRHPPGILVPAEPVQTETGAAPWEFKGYRIVPLASFRIRALVLHRMEYSTGRESDLSPVDLAVGWGLMSDQQVIDRFEISQSGRWYDLRWRSPPLPVQTIMDHSSNMHIVPADDEVEDALSSVHRGDVVSFEGYLIEARGSGGWGWRSSISRTDRGQGACELVFVRSIKVE